MASTRVMHVAPRSDSIYIDYLRNIRVKNIVVEDGSDSELRLGENRKLIFTNGSEIYYDGTAMVWNVFGHNIEFKQRGDTGFRYDWSHILEIMRGYLWARYGTIVLKAPTNLSGKTGVRDGEIRLDDGSNTSHRGMPCVWDDVNSVWVRAEDGTTFT